MSNQLIDKALAYVGKNIQKPIIMRYVQVTIQRKYSKVVSLSAPDVDGYTFLVWVNFATDGWIGSVYAANPLAQNTDIWNSTYGTSGTDTGKVVCYAMYIRNDLV